jgi:hypothetical protein
MCKWVTSHSYPIEGSGHTLEGDMSALPNESRVTIVPETEEVHNSLGESVGAVRPFEEDGCDAGCIKMRMVAIYEGQKTMK